MTEVGVGKVIYELRKKIQNLTSDLNNLENDSKNIPELISSTNLLRSNEHLVDIIQKSSELILAYGKYADQLEQMLSTVFDIQKDLKEILKTQTSLISENHSKKKPKSRKKNAKK